MDNEYTQSEVAYETKPKETNKAKGLPSGDKQFGKNKMPQDAKKPATKGYVNEVMERHVESMHKGQGRHKEHR